MGTKFDKIVLLASGDLLVEGPFVTYGEVVDDVVVRVVVSANGERYGTAIVPESAVITSGTTTDVISRARFSTTVSGLGVKVGDTVRAIGLSVALKRADAPDPSAFETFTWCVKFEVTSETTEQAA